MCLIRYGRNTSVLWVDRPLQVSPFIRYQAVEREGGMHMANEEQLAIERARLAMVVAAIERQLQQLSADNASIRRDIVEGRRHLFETESHDVSQWDTVVELATYMQQEYVRESVYLNAKASERRMRALLVRPYFGSFDFRAAGNQESERLYVGIQSLLDDNGEELVCDWRAPIASLFYEDRLGSVSYTSPLGRVEADILGKRQFIIKDGTLTAMFDTDLAIGDDVLREVLSGSGGERMHPIVATIQREQNTVIRDAEHRVLVVQGAAGSGKSSVAMQRVAFLLYKHRGHVSQDQIVIFAPNNLFADYISRVLPELGEEDVTRSTFPELAHALLGAHLKLETPGDRMEMRLHARDSGSPDHETEIVNIKGRARFADVIAAYVRYLQQGAMPFADLSHDGRLVVRGETLAAAFALGRASLPLDERIGQVRRALKAILQKYHAERIRTGVEEWESNPRYMGTPGEIHRQAVDSADEEVAHVKRLAARLPCFHVTALYRELFAKPELFARFAQEAGLDGDSSGLCTHSARRLSSDSGWPREDLAPAMLLRMAMSGSVIRGDIKYVVVDEAQDYSACEWTVFRTLFPRARFTVAGDVDQALDEPPASIASMLADVFPASDIHAAVLARSYRQTHQLAAFCHALGRSGDAGEWLHRDGALPRIVQLIDENHRPAILQNEISQLQARGARAIAIIGKTATECRDLMHSLQGRVEAVHITEETDACPAGVIVIPSYLAKGLEFDAVVISDASARRYPDERDRRLLYTVCTRALHDLCALHAGTLTPLIEQMDGSLYERAHVNHA